MIDSSFFDDIDSIKAVNLKPECRYEIVITIYKEVTPVVWWRDISSIEEFTANNFINSIKDKIIRSLLEQGALSQETFEYVTNYEVKNTRTVFLIHTPFSSVKTKGLFSLFLNIAKIQKEDCVVSLCGKTSELIYLNYVGLMGLSKASKY